MSSGVEDAHASNRYEKLINIKDRGQIFRVDVDIDREDRRRRRLYVHLYRRQHARSCARR